MGLVFKIGWVIPETFHFLSSRKESILGTILGELGEEVNDNQNTNIYGFSCIILTTKHQ